MKLQLRSRKKYSDNIPSTPHGSKVLEAIDTTRKLQALREFPACKLTADAFIAETLAIEPKATLANVKRLRQALAKKPPNLAHTSRTLARMVSALRGPASNYRTPPTRYPGRVVTALSTPETTSELISFGATTIELFCAACQCVAETNPETWGTATSSEQHAAEVAALEARQRDLFAQLESKVSADDLNIDAEDRTAAVTYKAGNGKVPLAGAESGKRLVAYLMAQREQRQG